LIAIVSSADVLASAHTALGLPAGGDLDDVYLATSLRRLAGFLCPCSPKTLIRSMAESHSGMTPSKGGLAERVESILESLVAIGDLLELSHVTTLDETVKGTWVFAAPPSFVLRPSGNAFILGLSADEATPLPAGLRARIKYKDVVRVINPTPSEDLASTLRELGLRELSIEGWLRHPKLESAAAVMAALDTKLSTQGPCGEIADLRVLDHTRDARRYRDRWGPPTSLRGRFIVRRPQAYGADLWGYAELLAGRAVKLLDFPTPGARWRGCDMAWRAQMAIDALAGKAQAYVREAGEGGARLDFFSPIPDWARRRLSTIGEQAAPSASLLSFVVSGAELETEEKFLHDYLFLNRTAA
jgi:hypothetical protein